MRKVIHWSNEYEIKTGCGRSKDDVQWSDNTAHTTCKVCRRSKARLGTAQYNHVYDKGFQEGYADAQHHLPPIHIPRLPWAETFMLQAHLVATRATCDRGPELLLDPGRHGVGAVIVRDKRIIASGYNGSPPGAPHCDDVPTCPCCKGEFKKSNGDDPCPNCAVIDKPTGIVTGHRCDNCKGESKLEGGHLMKEGHCVRTIHSEMNALLQCALDETTPKGATIYCTASPCYDCTKAIIRAGIVKVVYGEMYDSRYGLSPTVRQLFASCGVTTSQLVLEIVDGRIRRAG